MFLKRENSFFLMIFLCELMTFFLSFFKESFEESVEEMLSFGDSFELVLSGRLLADD